MDVIAPVDQELTQLARIAWLVLIPAGLLMVMVLYKVFTILSTLSQLVTHAQYEVAPLLHSVRLTSEHVEALTHKARSGVEGVEKGIQATKPAMAKGMDSLKSWSGNTLGGVGSLMGGFVKAMLRR